MAQKQELWQQLGYDSFRDWRLADAKQRRATARKENRSPSCADSDQQPGCNPQINILLDWFESHDLDPYPSPKEKAALAKQVGMNVKQVEKCAPPCPIRHSVQLSPRTVTHSCACVPARPRDPQGSQIAGSAIGAIYPTDARARSGRVCACVAELLSVQS